MDIVTLGLSDELSDIGTLCVTFWKDIHRFFESFDTCQDLEFLTWIEKVKDDPETRSKIEDLRVKLKDGIQTRNRVQKDAAEYLLKRFGYDSNHDLRFNYLIDLSKAIERESLESKIEAWWRQPGSSVCYLEGEEGMGKSWLAAKCVKSICEDKDIVVFWLDSDHWSLCRSLDDMLQICLETLLGYQDERKLAKLKLKIRNIWCLPTLIVLDGVNEGNAIRAAKRIFNEYFAHKKGLQNRIHFLLTTRPLDAYRDFEHNLWNGCNEVVVGNFNNTELQEALRREELQPDDLPESLKNIASIPRYFQTCIRLRELFGSLDNCNHRNGFVGRFT